MVLKLPPPVKKRVINSPTCIITFASRRQTNCAGMVQNAVSDLDNPVEMSILGVAQSESEVSKVREVDFVALDALDGCPERVGVVGWIALSVR